MESSELSFQRSYVEDVEAMPLDDSDVGMDLDFSEFEGISEVGYLEEKYGPSLVLLRITLLSHTKGWRGWRGR